MPQAAEDEATHGREVLALEPRAKRFVRLPNGGEAVHGVGAVGELAHGRSLPVELVANLADYLLDYVFHCYDSFEGAPLVDDDGHAKPAVLEVLEEGVHAPILGDGQHLAHNVFGLHLRPKAAPVLRGAHHLLGVHRPDYPVRGAFLVDRVAGGLAGGYDPEELPQGHVCRQRGDVGAGDHDLTHRRVLEAQDSIQHAILTRAKHPLLGRAIDDQAQLVLRVRLLGLGGWGYPEEPNYGVGGAVEEDYAGPEQVVEEPHEGHHEKGGALRPGDG